MFQYLLSIKYYITNDLYILAFLNANLWAKTYKRDLLRIISRASCAWETLIRIPIM